MSDRASDRPPTPSAIRELLDRSAIDELHSRYLFALGWQDPDGVAETFAEDGVLHWAGGVISCRGAIRAQIERIGARFSGIAEAQAPLRSPRLRHYVTNKILDIDGDRARTLAFWFEIDNDNRHRWSYVGGYGHYEDVVVRTAQGWLFERRTIFNEVLEDRKGPSTNPARQGLSSGSPRLIPNELHAGDQRNADHATRDRYQEKQ